MTKRLILGPLMILLLLGLLWLDEYLSGRNAPAWWPMWLTVKGTIAPGVVMFVAMLGLAVLAARELAAMLKAKGIVSSKRLMTGNAIKFTHDGEVAVTVSKVASREHSVDILFSVRDTGIGIPKDRQGSVFEAFVQADGSTTRHYGGTGLGLTICRRLVLLMGGNIGLESEPGVGSNFYFTVPCEISEDIEGSHPAALSSTIPGQRVLIVDDNSTNRLILEEILHSWNIKAVSVQHGSEVRAVLEQAAAAGRPFNMMLLDLHMPDMDGFGVAKMVERLPCGSDIDIIMLSSSEAAHHRAQLQETRIAAFLTKPVMQSELLETILTLNAVPEETNTPAPVVVETIDDNEVKVVPRVLVVEDNFVNQQLMLRVLTKDGYEVLLAGDGNQAVQTLVSEKVDAILMDCQMPVVDGYEATRLLRQAGCVSRVGERIPIIALTANAVAGDRERCLEVGMDDFVTKPIQFSALDQNFADQHRRTKRRRPHR